MEPVEVRRAQVMRRLAEQHSHVVIPAATDTQLRYITLLLCQRRIDDNLRKVLAAEILGPVSNYRARQMIDTLKRLPYRN